MNLAVDRYVSSVQSERYFRSRRHYWVICCVNKPDELVAWGHAPTQELAEAAVRNQIEDLCSGLSKGGRVDGTQAPFFRH